MGGWPESRNIDSESTRVLIVEDDPGNAQLVKLVLSASPHFAFEVKVVERLSAAIECLRGDSFDVILLDLGLPDSQGLDTISKVQAENQETPIVVLTGFDDEEMGVRAMQEGAQDYLVKGEYTCQLLTRSVRYAVERKKVGMALRRANVRLQELDRLKNRFMANVSHELRTPLNSIIGFSEILLDGMVGEISPEQKGCVSDILSSGEHLLILINDILDLSKIEAGRMTLEPTTFDVAELLAEVQKTIMPLIEKKSQVLQVEQADGLPPLTADRFRIKQVLLNLLNNAYKFTPGGGHIGLSCHLADASTILFSVSDTGIGIKPEDQEIIFDEFRQVDGLPGQEITGTGLGLAISRWLIGLHGGRIWVESEPEHGATFSFLLPLAGPPAAEPGSLGEVRLPSSGKVLVVEDSRQFSNLLVFYLRQEGYTPIQHYGGVGVLDRARELKPALITLDVRLPDLDGWEVLRALKSDPQTKGIPVLVISVLEDGALGLSLGAVDYLVKPVRRDDLQGLLNRLAAPAPTKREVKVLVMDDDPDLIPLLQAMLSAENYTLLSACNGMQGLAMARSEHPDVILLDLLMPGMSGFEVLEKLADAETADIPVIVLTAIDVTVEQRKLLDEHAQGLVRKGALTLKSLLAELHRMEGLASS
ncbi:MAG: response regulator [Chloroflexota bacterium]|nr:response regulator [Chloroflexota bacterium]